MSTSWWNQIFAIFPPALSSLALNLECTVELLRELLNLLILGLYLRHSPHSAGLGWGPGICIFKSFPETSVLHVTDSITFWQSWSKLINKLAYFSEAFMLQGQLPAWLVTRTNWQGRPCYRNKSDICSKSVRAQGSGGATYRQMQPCPKSYLLKETAPIWPTLTFPLNFYSPYA